MAYVLTKNKVPIFYRLIGSGDKTILFVHPPGMGHITFKQQLPLSKDYQLLFLDLRGNGKSGMDSTPISISLLAEDIFDVCQQLELPQVVLCGYSNGASIALEFSIKYPDMVEGLVLIGAFSKVNSFLLFGEFLLGIWATKLNGMPLIAKVIGQAHAYSKGFGNELEAYIRRTKASTLHQMYKEGVKYDCTNRLSEIKAPILLVYGKRDFYVHHYKDEFLAYHPQAKVINVSKAKHQVPTNFPNEFNTILTLFLKKLVNK